MFQKWIIFLFFLFRTPTEKQPRNSHTKTTNTTELRDQKNKNHPMPELGKSAHRMAESSDGRFDLHDAGRAANFCLRASQWAALLPSLLTKENETPERKRALLMIEATRDASTPDGGWSATEIASTILLQSDSIIHGPKPAAIAMSIALASGTARDGHGKEKAPPSIKEPEESLTMKAAEPKERESKKPPSQLILRMHEQGAAQEGGLGSIHQFGIWFLVPICWKFS